MADVLQHIKGSEVATVMANRIRPNQYYTITLESEDLLDEKRALAEWKAALKKLNGIWADDPEKEAEMADIRQECDRLF